MRRTIGKTITNSNNFHLTNVIKPTSSFSTSSSSGGGRGRGGGGPAQFDFVRIPGKPDSDESITESTESRRSGIGHGRGKPIASDPILPSYSSFVSTINLCQPGNGRGRVTTESVPSQSATESPPDLSRPQPPPPPPKKPIFVKIHELSKVTELAATESTESGESNRPSGIISVLSSGGAGRGKPTKQSGPTPQIKEENRHARARQQRAGPDGEVASGEAKPILSLDEKVKNAIMSLSRGNEGEEGGGRGRDGREGRGRREGRGGRQMQRYGDERRGRGRRQDSGDDDYGSGLYLGDNADGEKLAKKLGVENMNKLVEGFEEMSENVLPSPMEDAYVDALHTNYAVRVL